LPRLVDEVVEGPQRLDLQRGDAAVEDERRRVPRPCGLVEPRRGRTRERVLERVVEHRVVELPGRRHVQVEPEEVLAPLVARLQVVRLVRALPRVYELLLRDLAPRPAVGCPLAPREL